jgi:hypothetical protein
MYVVLLLHEGIMLSAFHLFFFSFLSSIPQVDESRVVDVCQIQHIAPYLCNTVMMTQKSKIKTSIYVGCCRGKQSAEIRGYQKLDA